MAFDQTKNISGEQSVEQQVLAALLEAFYDQDNAGKERTIAAFRTSPNGYVYPLLDAGIRNDENDRLRNAAMEIAVALRGRSVPFLVALLKDANEEVRTFSAVMLGTMKDSMAVPGLISALADSDVNVKHAAAEALGKIGDRRGVQPLIDVLNTDMWLQFPAAVALGDIGDSRAVAPLVELLSIPGSNIPAIQALGKLAHPSALPSIVIYLADEEPSIREWALEAVVETLSRNASAVVSELPVAAKPHLLETLESDRPSVRRNGVIALGFFKVAEAATTLRNLLTDPDVGEAVRVALSKINASRS